MDAPGLFADALRVTEARNFYLAIEIGPVPSFFHSSQDQLHGAPSEEPAPIASPFLRELSPASWNPSHLSSSKNFTDSLLSSVLDSLLSLLSLQSSLCFSMA